MTTPSRRDILGELFGDAQETYSREADILESLFAPRPNPTEGDPEIDVHVDEVHTPRKRSRKKKTTHYISKEVDKELDKAKRRLKRMAPRELKARMTKSSIVDLALRQVLTEFVAKKNDSALARELLQSDQENE
ncbi:MAG: hypothetical protein EOM25_09135 [Deltaproteobacteria bacterium]|nr:hypothetical protein [Deltaproteobacteria bacterium]